jgi:phosphoribosylanthranilate isomerase
MAKALQRIKICGITQIDQGRLIAQLGATDLGFICVAASPRYVAPLQLAELVPPLTAHANCVGVFADVDIKKILAVQAIAGFGSIQLHGQESIQYCAELQRQLPGREIIKAWRVRIAEDLAVIQAYSSCVDVLLLDAYHPDALGGTGHTLPWPKLLDFRPGIPWFLAGGLNPQNISIALDQLHPQGVDLSSGVEISPGVKDLNLVAALFAAIG